MECKCKRCKWAVLMNHLYFCWKAETMDFMVEVQNTLSKKCVVGYNLNAYPTTRICKYFEEGNPTERVNRLDFYKELLEALRFDFNSNGDPKDESLIPIYKNYKKDIRTAYHALEETDSGSTLYKPEVFKAWEIGLFNILLKQIDGR